jgi:hypothetical protein
MKAIHAKIITFFPISKHANLIVSGFSQFNIAKRLNDDEFVGDRPRLSPGGPFIGLHFPLFGRA